MGERGEKEKGKRKGRKEARKKGKRKKRANECAREGSTGKKEEKMAGRDDRRTPVISRKEKTKGEQKKEHKGAKTFLFLVIIPPLCQSRLPTATTTANRTFFSAFFLHTCFVLRLSSTPPSIILSCATSHLLVDDKDDCRRGAAVVTSISSI